MANKGSKTLHKAACDAGRATSEAWEAARVFPAFFAALCPAGCEYAFYELLLLTGEQVLLDQSKLMPNVSSDAFSQ